MSSKFKWKDYLTFSKKERNGAVIFLAVVGAVVAFPLFFNRNEKYADKQIADKNALAALSQKENFQSEESLSDNISEIKTDNLFAFNPNTISKEQWIQFGLSEKTANTIINYTSKGGRFYKAEDIRKIWGLKTEEADALIPFIQIPESGNNNYSPSFSKEKTVSVIDINTATAEEWKALPGIGDVLSERIVKYRNSVNGFSSVDDIKKVYGISDATFSNIRTYLKISNAKKVSAEATDKTTLQEDNSSQETDNAPKGKVNINTATERQMIAAGISRNVAKAIVVYREQNGKYSNIQDVKKIIFIDAAAYEKIAPLIVAE